VTGGSATGSAKASMKTAAIFPRGEKAVPKKMLVNILFLAS
jgi:hypothetical protein